MRPRTVGATVMRSKETPHARGCGNHRGSARNRGSRRRQVVPGDRQPEHQLVAAGRRFEPGAGPARIAPPLVPWESCALPSGAIVRSTRMKGAVESCYGSASTRDGGPIARLPELVGRPAPHRIQVSTGASATRSQAVCSARSALVPQCGCALGVSRRTPLTPPAGERRSQRAALHRPGRSEPVADDVEPACRRPRGRRTPRRYYSRVFRLVAAVSAGRCDYTTTPARSGIAM